MYDLDAVRETAEASERERTEERYRVHAGLKDTLDLASIDVRHEGLADPGLLAFLEGRAAGQQGEEQRRTAYLLDFVGGRVLERSVRDLVEARRAWEDECVVSVEGESCPFRSVPSRLVQEPERRRRTALWRAWVEALEEGLSPILLGTCRRLEQALQPMGFSDLVALRERRGGVDLRALGGAMEDFLARTADTYREVMGWFARRRLGLALADLEPHDVERLFHASPFETRFAWEGLSRVLETFSRDLGLDLTAQGRIRFDLEDRPLKATEPLCAPIQVPQKVMVVARPGGGHGAWQAFLEALGRALHFAHVAEGTPFEFRRRGEAAVPAAFGLLFRFLTLDAGWLAHYLEFPHPKDFLVLAWLERLYRLRGEAARLRCGLLFHGAPLDEARARETYGEHMMAALGFRHPRGLYLQETSPWLAGAGVLRACVFQAMLDRHLDHYFEEDWWRNYRAGRFLRGLWSFGQRMGVEEVARHIGHERLDLAPLVEGFERNL
ncbi:MAG: hypothetical protein HY722_06470 [Planctomycetes bacterium]|nr:hypothetical protein [Planctomycetota bacterium]